MNGLWLVRAGVYLGVCFAALVSWLSIGGGNDWRWAFVQGYLCLLAFAVLLSLLRKALVGHPDCIGSDLRGRVDLRIGEDDGGSVENGVRADG